MSGPKFVRVLFDKPVTVSRLFVTEPCGVEVESIVIHPGWHTLAFRVSEKGEPMGPWQE